MTQAQVDEGPARPDLELPARVRRRWPWIVGFLLAVLCLLVWYQRDLPRRRVESALEKELRADVQVGALEVLGRRRFALHDLEIRRMGGQPLLEYARVRRIEIEGSLARIRLADFDAMRVLGLEVRLRPPTGEPLPEPSTEPSTLRIGRLGIEGGTVVVAAGGAQARLAVDAELTGVGSDAVGEIRARSEHLPMQPFVALATTRAPGPSPGEPAPPPAATRPLDVGAVLQDFGASVRFTEGRTILLAAGSRAATWVHEGARSALPGVGLEATLEPEADGSRLALAVDPRLPFLRSGTFAATLNAQTWEILQGEGRLEGLDLGALARFVPLLPPGYAVEGNASASVDLVAGKPMEVAASGRLTRLRLPWADQGITTRDLRFQAAASLGRAGEDLHGPVSVRFQIPHLSARWGARSLPAGLAPLSASFDGHLAGRDRSLEGRASITSAGSGSLATTGRAAFLPAGGVADLRWTWSVADLSGLIEIARAAGVAIPDVARLSGRAEARGTLRGNLASPAVAATVSVRGLEVASLEEGTPWRLDQADGTARIVLPAAFDSISVPALALDGRLSVAPFATVPVRITGGGSYDLGSGRARLERAVLASPELGRLLVAARWIPDSQERVSFEASLQGADMSRWLPILKPILGDPLQGYSVKGTASAELRGGYQASGRWTARGGAAIAKSGFESEDGGRALEGFDSAWDLTLEGSGLEAWTVRADAGIQGFQLLWGTVFADYSGLESRLGVTASSTAPGWGIEARWRIPDGPGLTVSLEPAPDHAIRYTLAADVPDLHSTVARHLREPLGGSIPYFEKIEAQGSLVASGGGTFSDTLRTVTGELALHQLGLEGTQGVISVQGLDLLLPFDLRWERSSSAASAPGLQPTEETAPTKPWTLAGGQRRGKVRFERVVLAGLELPPVESGLSTTADALAFEEDLGVRLLGGLLRFEGLVLGELLRGSRYLRSAVLVSDVSLQETSRTFELPTLEGSIYAYFPHVRLTPQALYVEGGGEVQAFGGTVKLGDIAGQDVLSRFPKFEFSATFDGVDLGRVTRTFDAGEMNGVVRGYVRDLRLFRGVPVRFEAQVESVPTDGVPQNINVKAIKNLTVLGTGGNISPLDRGLQRFLDKYTYRALGIWMKLDDDTFELRGLERRGDQELFLEGRLPFPINIVNAQPGRKVSFRSMVARLGSLDLGAAKTGAAPREAPGKPPQAPVKEEGRFTP